MWVDGVLMNHVYASQYWPSQADEGETRYQKAPYSLFTVSKYNRLMSPIRFRQVRVIPTLPSCRQESADPLLGEEISSTCTNDPQDSFLSCSTPADNHELSRPCWGAWNKGWQDHSYPTKNQLETAQLTKNDSIPEQDIECKLHCHAYFRENKRGCAEREALCEPGMYKFISSFYQPTAEDEKLEEGYVNCQKACDVTDTKQLGGLSAFAGKEDSPNFCGSGDDQDLKISYPEGCWGDVVDLPLDSEEAHRLVRAMKRERWTHEGTRGVAIDINMYNSNFDMATVMRVSLEQTEGGRLDPHIEVMSCRLNPYTTSSDKLRLALEVIFTFWLVWYLGVEVVEMYQLRAEYLDDVWNYIELINLGIYFYTMFYWYAYCTNPELEKFKVRTTTEFKDLYTIAKHYNLIGLVSSFNLIWGFIRFFKYFRLYSRFAMLWDALGLAMKSIMPFMFALLLIITSFCWSGHWLFGPRYIKFHKYWHTFMALIISLTDGLDYDVLKKANPGPLPVWFFGWTLVSSLVLVNVLIAIITDAFAKAKDWNYRLRAQEEQAAVHTRMESLMLFLLHECCPFSVGKGSDKKPSEDSETPQELHERSLELKSMVNEIDTEKLWSRLMEGVKNGEVALDSSELAFLFNGSEKDARLFIDRICTIGGLRRVDQIDQVTTLDTIHNVENQINGLDDHVGGIAEILEQSYPELLPHLYPELYEEVHDANQHEHHAAFLALTEGKDVMDAVELQRQQTKTMGDPEVIEARLRRGGTKKFKKVSNQKRTGGMFGEHAPQRGDLKRACQALELKKQNAGELEAEGGGAVNMDSLTSGAMEEFIASPKLQRL